MTFVKHQRIVTTCAHEGCDKPVVTSGNMVGRALCDVHRRQHKQENRERLNENRRTGNPPGCPDMICKILHDPDKAGGFDKGAEIPSSHIDYMRKFCSFTPGTILMKRSRIYRVVGTEKQKLVQISKEECKCLLNS